MISPNPKNNSFPRHFYIGALAFVLGVFFRSFVDLGVSFAFFILFIGASISIYRYSLLRGGRVASPALLGIAVCILTFGVGVLRFDLSAVQDGDSTLDARVGSFIVLEGVVVEEPVETDQTQRLVVAPDFLVEGNASQEVESRILVTLERHPSFSYGDRLRVSGTLEEPESFETESGSVFDYAAFLAKDGIFYTMFRPDTAFVALGEGNPVIGTLLSGKERFLSALSNAIPEPHVSLIAGEVLGVDESLGDELEEDLRRAGVIHIVVLSGYNVTIAASFFMAALGFLRGRVREMAGIFGIILFALLTGFSATVVRASIMAILVLLARSTRRRYDITRAIVVAGLIMMLVNPRTLVFDPSFQLSFLATLGLVYISPLLDVFFRWVPKRFALREVVCATLSTQMLVLPLLLTHAGELSLVSLPANILILPAVPYTMFFGFVAGVIGMLLPILSIPFAYVATLLAGYQLFVAETLAGLPLSALPIPLLPLWLALIVYGILGLFVIRMYRKHPRSLEATAGAH